MNIGYNVGVQNYDRVIEEVKRIALDSEILDLLDGIEETSGAEAHLTFQVDEETDVMTASISYQYQLRDGTIMWRTYRVDPQTAEVRFEKRRDRIIIMLRNALQSSRQDGKVGVNVVTRK